MTYEYFLYFCAVKITIDGNATVFPDGDVTITFQSNVDKVSFECIIVDDDEDMPEVTPCKYSCS